MSEKTAKKKGPGRSGGTHDVGLEASVPSDRLQKQLQEVMEFMQGQVEGVLKEIQLVRVSLGEHEWKLEMLREVTLKLAREHEQFLKKRSREVRGVDEDEDEESFLH
jgi:hypothetical protein